jgi:hypothetical protein
MGKLTINYQRVTFNRKQRNLVDSDLTPSTCFILGWFSFRSLDDQSVQSDFLHPIPWCKSRNHPLQSDVCLIPSHCSVHTHDGSMVLLYMVTWIHGSHQYTPSHVSINIPYPPWIRHGIWDHASRESHVKAHVASMDFPDLSHTLSGW